jgi:2-oxoglutarate dehydrogenase E2 component (dihydrolipoamide succinyltransferase)
LVRRLIIEHGLDPDQIPGTGVGGRITREDVLDAIDRRAAAAGASPAAPPAPPPPDAAPPASEPPPPVTEEPAVPPAPETSSSPTGATAAPPAPPATVSVAVTPVGADTVEKLSNIRLRTGEHMLRSRATSPHAITAIDVDYEAVERARKPLRAQFRAEEGFSLTYLPFIARAVIDALSEFPHMNATVGDGELIVHNYVNLSIAVDLDFQGLLAPVIKGADGKRLRAIAREIHDLAERARSKRLVPDDLAGGTFTLSNSGSYGTLFVAPIINQPQVAILSTDGIKRRPVVVELPDGTESIAIHSVGNLTMSWDHRAFDGAYAAAFLARVKEIIETRDWTAEL